MRTDEDQYLDEESEGASRRSLLASGWIRALLVLGALILLLFVTLPYLLRSNDRSRPAERAASVARPAPSMAPTPALPAAQPPGAAARAVTPTPAAPPAAPSATTIPASTAPTPGKAERREPAPVKDATKGPTKVATDTARGPAAERAPTDTVAAAASGQYWVQAGAFESDKNAERLAERLCRERLGATVSRIGRGGDAAGRHEVVVTGANAGAVNTLLQGKGNARDIAGAVVIEPALDLKDAVALSKRLAAEGLTVKIRRVGDSAPATLHVVSVGPYSTRASAEAAARDLTAQGVRGFVRQGPPR